MILQKDSKILTIQAQARQSRDQQIRGILRENDQLRKLLQGNKIKLDHERNANSGEIKALYDQYAELRDQMRSLQDENLNLVKQNNKLKEQAAQSDYNLEILQHEASLKERDVRDVQFQLERSDQQIQELKYKLNESALEANALRNQIAEIQSRTFELEKDCDDVHKNRENLLFEEKRYRGLISKLKEQIAEKEQMILSEIREKDKANKEFEDAKRDLIELTKALESSLSEEERRRYALPQMILNGSDMFVFMHERIRAVLIEKEKITTRLEDMTTNRDRVSDEKVKLEKENETCCKK